jgi:hypothetical protein
MGNSKESVNLCHQVGCPDICCHDMWLNRVDHREREQVFPNAKKVEFNSPVEGFPFGVYVLDQLEGTERELVYISGPCQHLVKDGCDGTRTTLCSNFIFDGDNCKRLRKKYGLSMKSENGSQVPIKKSFIADLLGYLSAGRE